MEEAYDRAGTHEWGLDLVKYTVRLSRRQRRRLSSSR